MEKLVTEVQNIKDISLIKLKGNLTSDADEPLFSLINTILSEGISKLIFDLSSIDYINSAGFGILIALIDEIKTKKVNLKFAALTPHFNKTAKLIGLHRFVDFHRTVDDAFASLQ